MMQLKKSNTTTPFCKICFKPIEDNSFHSLLFGKTTICESCYLKSEPEFIEFKESGVNCLAIYEYSDYIRKLLYQFKGANDYELNSTFFDYILPYLKLKFHGYYIIPVPSSKSHNQNRGYNQVIEMFKFLDLPILDYLEKTKESKQSSLSYKERFKSADLFDYGSKATSLAGKKVVIVDDVYTSGTSLRACIDLIKRLRPKKIKALLLAKTKPPLEIKLPTI